MKSPEINSSNPSSAGVRRFRERMREMGLVKKDVWIRPEYAPDLSALEKGMRSPGWSGEASAADGEAQSWTVDALEKALATTAEVQAGLIEVHHLEGSEPSIRLRVNVGEGIDVLLAISGEQLLGECYLWPASRVTDVTAFNEHVLRTQKYLPLSAFSITDIGGDPAYTLFGALDSRSSLASILMEVEALAENAQAFSEL